MSFHLCCSFGPDSYFPSIISLGKFGSFQTNQILGRPFHLTFEILDRAEIRHGRELRVVSTAELHADALIQQAETPAIPQGGTQGYEDGEDDVAVDSRTNKNIVDDPSNQRLTMAEIEALKTNDHGSAKEIIAKILDSHSTIDQKTAFSLAKYTLRKKKKYMRRFCVLPLDVLVLTDWLMKERDFGKVLELRNEMLGLIGCWANVHHAGRSNLEAPLSGQYLVVDDTGGLIVAAMAERMGILYMKAEGHATAVENAQPENQESTLPAPMQSRKGHHEIPAMSASSNTITLLHSNSQPNLALLKYFSFDANTPPSHHPLYLHLKTLSWLQLLYPDSDPAYTEPEAVSPDILAGWKSSKRSGYYRKRRRWTRIKSVVDSTRRGGFHGLVLATLTSPVSILHHAVPLLAGSAQVVVYSPHIEPLAELADLYSTARRTAFLNTPEHRRLVPSEDFPLDPTLLLSPTVQTVMLRRWQVLSGRTHPLMMGRGGAEGYVFVGTRVLSVEGNVQARGKTGGKRRRVEGPSHAPDGVEVMSQAET